MFLNFNAYKSDRKKFLDVWSSVVGGIAATLALEMIFTIITLIIAVAITQQEQPTIPMCISLYGTLGGIFGTWWIIRGQKWKGPEVGVLFNKQTLKEYFLGAGLALIMLVLSIVPAFVAKQATFSYANLTSADWLMWGVYGIGFVIQSFSEEYLCRGLIMKRLNQRYNIWWSVFIQAAIFMLLHAGNPGMGVIPYVNLLLWGIIFGQVVLLTDNLMLASGLHWLWNFAQGCIFGIKVSGLDGMTTILNCEMNGHHMLTGGDFGIEGTISTTIVSVMIIAMLSSKMVKVIRAKSTSSEPIEVIDANPEEGK